MKVVGLSSHQKSDTSSASCTQQSPSVGDLIEQQSVISEIVTVPSAIPEQEEIPTQHDPDLGSTSPLDMVMTQYLAQKSHQDAFVQYVVQSGSANNNGPETTLQVASPNLHFLDLKSADRDWKQFHAVVRYTFGDFFIKCLHDDCHDVRIACIQTAERFSVLLKDALGSEIAYEGLTALATLSLQDEHSPVFRSTLHLVQTLFQDQPFATGSDSLEIVSSMAKGRISSGLRPVVQSILGNPCCWSINGAAGTSNRKQAVRSVDRSFLSFIRMLMSQNATRSVLFQVMLPLQDDDLDDRTRIQREFQRDQRHWIQTTNTFRLIRWLLSSSHQQNPPLLGSTIERIQAFCKQHLGKQSLALWKSRKEIHKIQTIALECLHLADSEPKDPPEDRRLHSTDNDCKVHRPLFAELPFTQEESARYKAQLESYFNKHPRPLALYHHAFTQESLQDHRDTFSKGNIAFRGQVERRTPPTRSFHQQILQNTQPFEFRTPVEPAVPSTGANLSKTLVEVKSSFALFKGTLEERKPESSTPRSSSRQKPELQPKAAPSTGWQRSRSSRVASAKIGDAPKQQEQPPRVDVMDATSAATALTPGAKDDQSPDPPTLSQVATAVAIAQAPVRLSSAAPSSKAQAQVPSPARHPKTAPQVSNRSTDKSTDANGCTLQ